MIRALLALFCGVVLGAATSNIRVTILAIDEFNETQSADISLNSRDFRDSMDSAVKTISDFFKTHHEIEATVIRGREQTTKAAIQQYLNTEYLKAADPTVTLFFVLSHGFGHEYSKEESEIFIATSQSDRSNFIGTGLEGAELVRRLARVPPRSPVFLFLDTCQSGSVNFAAISKLLADSLEGRRFMVMAASDRGSNAYNFNFSHALIELWKSSKENDCQAVPDEIDKQLNDILSSLKGTAPQQSAQTIVEFDGYFCIESFGRDRGLAILFNPSNHQIQLSYREKLTTKTLKTRPVKPKKVVALSLKPSSYVFTVAVSSPNSPKPREQTFELVLSSNRAQFIPLDGHDGTIGGLTQLGNAQMRAAAISARWGAEKADVSQLLDAGSVTLAQVGIRPDAPLVAKSYVRDYNKDDSAAALAINFAALKRVDETVRYKYLTQKLSTSPAQVESVAVLLGQAGDYITARRLCADSIGKGQFKQPVLKTPGKESAAPHAFENCEYFNGPESGQLKDAASPNNILVSIDPPAALRTPDEWQRLNETAASSEGHMHLGLKGESFVRHDLFLPNIEMRDIVKPVARPRLLYFYEVLAGCGTILGALELWYRTRRARRVRTSERSQLP